jgi:hypothetical protein
MAVRHIGTVGWTGSGTELAPRTYRSSSVFYAHDVWQTRTVSRHYSYIPNLTILNGTLTTGYYFSFFPYWSANVSRWAEESLKGDRKKQIYQNISSSKWLFTPEFQPSEATSSDAVYSFPVKAYDNPDAIPRASVVSSCRLFSVERELLAFLESPDFDPGREVSLFRDDTEACHNPSEVTGAGSSGLPRALIVGERPDRIEIELEYPMQQEGFLVLSDTYYPGWRAEVDGNKTKILRANYAFRAIKLSKGATHIVFFYKPFIPDALLFLPTLILGSFGAGGLFHKFFTMRKGQS